MRNEARIRMGYYPTPLTVVERVRTFLNYPEGNVNVLDPCCGEGLALNKLTEGANATTYGIELDKYRAGQAKAVLNHVLKGSYEDARITNNAFSCLFLNPPYDWESGRIPEEGSERKEKSFLRGTVNYLQPRGPLIYIVPQKRVTDDIARILSYRFGDFNLYRFPDDEYEQFRQIVLFGAKRQESYLNGESFDMLRAIPHEELDEIPFMENPVYNLPPSGRVRLFRSSVIDEAELERELGKSCLWERLKEYGRDGENSLGRPPLPLHTGHLGLLLASGCLDGVFGEGDDRHIVRGKVEKVTCTEHEYQGDVMLEKEREGYRVSIKVMGRDGDIKTLV